MIDERIPYLTVGERADLHGLSFNEELALEAAEPWIRGWAARHRAGAEHLRAWLAAGRPAADRGRLQIGGDRRIVAAVRAVVAQLPEAVAWFLVGNALVRCGGIETRGRCSTGLRPPCADYVLVELFDDEPGIIAHEMAHAYHWRPLAARLDAAELEDMRGAFCAHAIEENTVDELIADQYLHERAADALARFLGFHDRHHERRARRTSPPPHARRHPARRGPAVSRRGRGSPPPRWWCSASRRSARGPTRGASVGKHASDTSARLTGAQAQNLTVTARVPRSEVAHERREGEVLLLCRSS